MGSLNKMIYDNAFRTMVEKTPELIVMLINEFFSTDYSSEEAVIQSRNEHETENGEVITDSVFIIRGKTYHIECQAYDDNTMAIRMVEYDFLIAIEEAEKHGGTYRIKFPETCVLYIRKRRMRKETLDVEIEFPNGETVKYQARAIPTLSYTIDDIFDKKLYALLPYYILKYENQRDVIESSKEKREVLLKEYSRIADKLVEVLEQNPDAGYVMVILELVKKIVDELLKAQPEIRKGIGETMGGMVLSLASDARDKEMRDKGEERATKLYRHLMQQGNNDELQKAMDDPEYREKLMMALNL